MSMIYKYGFETKIEAVRLYIRLKNAAEAGRILKIHSSLIRMWHRQYLIGGPKTLIPQCSSNEYDIYDKILITEELLKKDITLTDASAMYGVSSRTLGRWLKSVQQQGFTGLFDKIPSSAVPTMAKKRKNKSEPLSELEQLREENLRLRAELDLIKKVEALVTERCKRITESVQKPSKS